MVFRTLKIIFIMRHYFLFLAIILIGISCKNTEKISKNDKEDVEVTEVVNNNDASGLYDIWGLVKLNGIAVNVKEQMSTPMIEINTTEYTLIGSTGCNKINATFKYNVEDNTFVVSTPFAMTKMGCPENSIESDFIKALESVNKYSKKGVNLYLMADDKVVMEFRKMD